jgi:hypothetical protein
LLVGKSWFEELLVMSTGRPLVILFALTLGSASPSPGQVSTAELIGTVADPTGAVISGAKVIATNAGTGVSREASSDATGGYVMTLLPPGNYNLSVEAQGFHRLLQSGVALEVNQHPNGRRPPSAERFGQADLAAVGVAAQIEVDIAILQQWAL